MEQDQFDQIGRLRARQRRRFALDLTPLGQRVCYTESFDNSASFHNQCWRLSARLASNTPPPRLVLIFGGMRQGRAWAPLRNASRRVVEFRRTIP
jgi:hypothetical protein